MSEQSTSSGGVGFGRLLALLFIGLKLGGIINWSWWWVLSPLWIGLLAVVLFVLVFIALGLIFGR